MSRCRRTTARSPRSAHRNAKSSVPREAVEDRPAPAPPRFPAPAARRRARPGRGSSTPCRWPWRSSMCRRNDSSCARPAVGLGPEVVEAGLADRDHARLGRQRRRSPPRPRLDAVGDSLGWIATAAQTSSRRRSQVCTPPRRRHVDADLHDPLDPDGVRRRHHVVDVRRPSGRGGSGCRERVRRAAPGPAAASPVRPGSTAHAQPSAIRASSSSTTAVSSFANNGVGGAIGVPGLAAGSLSQRDGRRVVAGQHRVRRAAVEVLDLAQLGLRREHPVAAEQLVHLLRGVRQERREQRRAVADRLQRDVQDRRHPLGSVSRSFHGAWSERYLLASATTRIVSPSAARIRERSMSAPTVANAARVVASSAWSASVSSPGCGDRAEVLRRERQRPVDQVAPGGDQLVVVAAHELRPGEVGVVGLRPGGGQVVAQRVRRVAGQEVADVDHDVAARGELPPLHREELARHDLARQLQLAELARACRRCEPLPS